MHVGLDRSQRKIAAYLFLSLNFLFLLTSSGRVRIMDEVTLAFEVESFAGHATTAIPDAVDQKLFYGQYDRFGRPQGPYGLGNVLLLLPWFWLGKAAAAITPGIPADRTILFRDAFTVASSATFSALAATFAFLIFLRIGLETRTALAAALMLALATPLFSYSSWFYSEPLASVLLLGATFFLVAAGPAQPLPVGNAALAGLFLSALLWVRAYHVIAVPIFLAALLLRGPKPNWRAVLALGTVVALFGLAYLARNKYLFGNPFEFGYPTVAEGGKSLNSFATPFATGLFGFLLSPGKSVFLFAPPLFLAVAGIHKLFKLDRALAVVSAGIPLAYLLFFATYTQWEGGYSYGPRYLVPAIAVASLGLGPVLAGAGRWTRRAALALFLAAVAIQGIGMATSFIEDMATGAYYEANWTYRLGYSPIPRMSRQLYHYIVSPTPTPLGRGFDRWFVFLGKAGVSRVTLACGIAFELAGLVFFARRLRRAMAASTRGAPPATVPDENILATATKGLH